MAKYIDESMKCPRCGLIAVKLVPPWNTGKGIKICRPCKKKSKKAIVE